MTSVDALDALLAVQEHDTAIDRLVHRRAHLPERAAVAELETRRSTLATDLAAATTRRDEVAARQQALEDEAAAAGARAAEVDKRLYSGTVTASRDLVAMQEEIASLKKRQSSIEDDVLTVMEEREPLDAEVDRLQAEVAAVDAELDARRSELAAAEKVVDDELAVEREARTSAAAPIPADLAATYEKLRTKHGGIGAAKLVGTSCSGCHLTLPATEIARIKKAPPDELLFCDSCGRILVR